MSPRDGSRSRFWLMALVRLLAAASLLAVGGVHIQQYIVQDYRVIPTIGPLFLLNFIGGTVLGLYFLIPLGRRPGRLRLLIDAGAAFGGSLLAAGAFVGLVYSEHAPLFGFMEHGYRFAIVFALASEAVAVIALATVLIDNRTRARRGRDPGRRGGVTRVVSAAGPTRSGS